MDATQFCYWAQGFFEIARPTSLNTTQVQEIKNHIQLVKDTQNPNGAVMNLIDYFKDANTRREPTYCSSVESLTKAAHEVVGANPIFYTC